MDNTMRAAVRVHECADFRSLARAVIAQAVRDMRNKRQPVKQVDALLWLTSDDFPLWAEFMDAPFMDPFRMLSIGGTRQLDRKGEL
jgi:hypothetical protein